MAPTHASTSLSYRLPRRSDGPVVDNGNLPPTGNWRQAAEAHPQDLVLESWSQGFIVGALLVMACITVANMRSGVVLHKLILLELLLAMSHGTFCFMTFEGNGWYLSSTAALLYFSWIIHNIVAWMKVRPFFTQPGGFFKAKIGTWVRRVYLGTLALTVPVIAFQVSDNFRFFNNRGGWYVKVRPYEPLMRDPWWVFTCVTLFHVIRKCYGTGAIGLIKRSPRFGILLSAISLSITFTIIDIIASIHDFIGDTDGINPWWKLSLVFKCLTDTIMLDDFKTELKRLGIKRIEKEEARRNSVALVTEYPSGLDGADPSDYSRPRRDTIFRYNQSPFQSKSFGSDSTVTRSIQGSRDLRDEKQDPLSEHAIQQELLSPQKGHSPNTSNAQLEEVEFAAALALGPGHDSGGSRSKSGNRRCSERGNICNSTKKLSRLPDLNRFRFEAIKPGKKTNTTNNDDNENEDDNNSDRGRTLAEEIQRTTIMDLEAQRRARATHVEERDVSASDSDEEKRRLNRFKYSIGAAE